jgi:hypothetical protein
VNDPVQFSPATTWEAEGGRVGIVICLRCGGTVLLSMEHDTLSIHADWHARVDA